ncbi:MAG: hypothetical protein FJ405_01155 [Verrucomicrobia bacterium]|nr:hypothetical protein [Verrucomicrobiota bacterium]
MNPRRLQIVLYFHLLLVGLFRAGASEGQLLVLVTNGPISTSLNLVMLAEGYTRLDQELFETHARRAANGILGAPPFSSYQRYFNVFGIFVESREAGADKPQLGIQRDTYFNSTYRSFGIDRLLTIPPNDVNRSPEDGEGKVNRLLMQLIPEYDVAAVLVNDSDYGGSGGPILVISANSAAAELAAHEMGHSFARLGDEYSDPFPGYPDIEEPNTTREIRRELLKWRKWVLASTPIPTSDSLPFRNLLGLFEGAHYHAQGWYRPRYECKMRRLNRPFCEVCAESLTLNVFTRLGVVRSTAPLRSAAVPVSAFLPQRFSLETFAAPDDAVHVEWTLNASPLATTDVTAVELIGSSLGDGTNVLKASVRIESPRVRNDPAGALGELVVWHVFRDPHSRPPLQIRQTGDGVELLWPGTAGGFRLETSTEPQSSSWRQVPGTPLAAGGFWMLRLPLADNVRFFRLNRE